MSKPHYQVAAAVIIDGEELLVARRGKQSRHPGRWEFPGGKREAGETIEECLIREIKEELNLDVKLIKKVASVEHEYDDISIDLHAFICRLAENEEKPGSNDHINWVKPCRLADYNLLPPDRKILVSLLNTHLIKEPQGASA